MNKYFYVALITLPVLFIEFFLHSITKENFDGRLLLFNKTWYTLLPVTTPSIPNEPSRNGYKIYDPILGWKINKNSNFHPYYSNFQGLRVSEKDTSKKVKVVSTDILTIGDSFTHGDEVLFEETWPFFLEIFSNRKVVNLGTSAYGVDQAILSYLISPIETDTVILGLISRDLERATSIIYPSIYHGGSKTKPIFKFQNNNKYQILNQPCLYGAKLRREFSLGENSDLMKLDKNFDTILFKNDFFDFFYFNRIKKMFLYRNKHIVEPIYVSPTTKNYKYILKIFNVFYDQCLKKNDFPIISLLDNSNSFADREKYANPWKYLILDLQKIGFKVIEPSDSLPTLFKRESSSVINLEGVHYTPSANKIVARHIDRHL